MSFVPRLTAPLYTDKYWIRYTSGGYNMCIYASGTSCIPNCFSGETRIITDSGIVRLDEIVGRTVNVLSMDGVYRPATGHEYGVQRVYQIGFSNGDEYVCTANHRWIVRGAAGYDVKTTLELTCDDDIPYAASNRLTSMQYVVYLGYKTKVYCVEEPETHTFALESGILTGNCVGYAYGRFMEIMGKTTCNLSTANAGKWFGNTKDGYERGNTPRLGAVICWSKAGEAGHVAIVEKILSDGSIVTSNSGWQSTRFYTQTLKPPNYSPGSKYRLQGFIYNPAITEYNTVTTTDGYIGYGELGPLYTTQNTQEDDTLREVCYVDTNGVKTLSKTPISLSVINYTTLLNSMVSSLLPANTITGTLGSDPILDGVTDTRCRATLSYLYSKGLSIAAAVGIAANIKAESNFNAAAKGDYVKKVPTSFGICQWHNNRGAAMKSYVGANWETNLSGQLDYLLSELSVGYSRVFNKVKAVQNTENGARSAADIFVREFEIPANVDAESKKRQNNASEIWNQIIIQRTAAVSSSMSSSLSVAAPMSGNTINIPSTVNQAGITGNYTNYAYFFTRWAASSVQRKLADIWDRKGRKSNRGIATIDGFYLCALTLTFGTTGDKVSIVLTDGTVINAIIGDSKGVDPSKNGESGNIYGHSLGSGRIDVVEWEAVESDTSRTISTPIDTVGWSGKKVAYIVNGGSYI